MVSLQQCRQCHPLVPTPVGILGALSWVIMLQWGGRSSPNQVQGILGMMLVGRGWIWGYWGVTVWWSDTGCCRGQEVKLGGYEVLGDMGVTTADPAIYRVSGCCGVTPLAMGVQSAAKQ